MREKCVLPLLLTVRWEAGAGVGAGEDGTRWGLSWRERLAGEF